MRTSQLTLWTLALVAALGSGCAFSTTTVKLEFKPPASEPKVDFASTIQVKKVTDARGVEPTLLANKGVGVKTRGRYLAEREVAEIVTDAIRESLASVNYKISADARDLVLSGDILKFDSLPMMGFWSGTVDGVIQLNLKLTDAAKGTVLWTEIVSGGFKKTGVQVDHEGHRKEVTEGTLQDAMKKLLQSASFREAVGGFKKPSGPT